MSEKKVAAAERERFGEGPGHAYLEDMRLLCRADAVEAFLAGFRTGEALRYSSGLRKQMARVRAKGCLRPSELKPKAWP